MFLSDEFLLDVGLIHVVEDAWGNPVEVACQAFLLVAIGMAKCFGEPTGQRAPDGKMPARRGKSSSGKTR
jgi:hypothetical protein